MCIEYKQWHKAMECCVCCFVSTASVPIALVAFVHTYWYANPVYTLKSLSAEDVFGLQTE